MSKQPHILIFNPDQWRGDTLGHLGNPAAQTPVLDRLVREEAVSFQWSFCQNTVCTPSRCSFMSGWYPHVHGHRTMHHMLHRDKGEPMLLDILRDNGYHVFWGGKNDLVPGQEGKHEHADQLSDYDKQPDLQPNWHGPVYQEARGELGQDSFYSFYIGKMEKEEGYDFYRDDDWLHVQEAIRQVRERPSDKPLCLYLPLVYPHPPYGVEEPFFSAIDRSKLPPRASEVDFSKKPHIIRQLRENFGMEQWSEERWDELRATYYGMCMRIDALLGQLIDVMQQEGIWDDTAMFFFADHGDFTGDYGLVEKTQNTFEDCLSRVPFVVKPPKGVECKPGVRDSLTELVDFSETVYDLTGIEPNYDRFGKSLLPALADEAAAREHRDAVFCEGGRHPGERQAMEGESVANKDDAHHHPYWPRIQLQITDDKPYHSQAAMCRTHDWKYVRRQGETDELYDLKNDPGETRNLIDAPECRDVLIELKERLLNWYQTTCDVVPHDTDRR